MELGFAIMTALWLGLLTSISPCPLATNIAAISFISHKSNKIQRVLSTGAFYVLGRILAYCLLSFLIVGSVLAIPATSFFFQKYIHLMLGPLLIIVGMFLLELISFSLSLPFNNKFFDQKYFVKKGIAGPVLLGFVFSLAFCPVSAALYFGSLIPLAVNHHSPLLVSFAYGVGTALPVLFFSFALAGGSRVASNLFNKVTLVEKWLRLLTGTTIIIVGIYFCLAYIFKII